METDYWHSLDQESPFRINPKTLGVSTAINKKAIDQLKARVFEGARNVELGFMGKEKGSLSQGGTNPEMHSKEEREEARQLAKINEVDLSTHTTVALGNTSGITDRGFKDEEREKAIHEIERTIDFAADVAQGGPVVVHTGEFSRPIYEAEKGKFIGYEGEPEKAPVFFVDKDTGDLKGIERDKRVPIPVKDKQGNYVRNDKGELQVEFKKYGDIEEEFKSLTPEEKKKFDKSPEKYFYNKMRDEEIGRYEIESEHYDLQAKEMEKNIGRLKKSQQFLESTKGKRVSPEIIAQIKSQPGMRDLSNDEVREALENPQEQIQEIQSRVDELQANKNRFEDGAMSYKKAAASAQREVENIVPIEQFGVAKTADSLARSAIYAYDREKAMKLKKPLFVAPENVFPEQFGAHPQELKKLVLEGRKAMVKKLQDERGMNIQQAQKIANDHVKATFDMGHANTWKKFFKREPGETQEQADKRFKGWMEKQTEDLQKSGVLGHVHLSDNFGYYDEHLAPGEGNVPIKELIDKLEKAGYKGKSIVEWGAQTPEQSFRVWSKALGLSSSTYKMDGRWSWTDMEGSYFGRTGSPTYIVGDQAPSKDWTLWSETPFE